MADQPYTNRLVNEKSPYLLQHAHNPVDWYPWGEEAFSAAKLEDKPILLSIGYATCHWCHVMEQESFENPEIAKLLNQTFINIKVDREEHPHVDSLYMEFAQSMMAGAAGWPLNVILTPNLQPFFAATYLPPVSRHGMMGLSELVKRIGEVWHGDERERVLEQAEKIVEVFAESIHVEGELLPEKEVVEDACETLFKMSDSNHGGMKGAPKFPIGYQYNLMMHYYYTMGDSRALFIAERTLDMMSRGGIHDHLGGGFHRYSVDDKWLVPHFEKMLYDNALLIHSYLEAWQISKKPLYQDVCEKIIHYILRDMQHPDGGFYSAEDADSEGHEGRFYTWTLDQVTSVLGKEESHLFCEYYNISEEGNFEGRNILNTPLNLEEFAAKHSRDPGDLEVLFKKQREILWKDRERRPHPLKDDKVLSSWNGLMIFSLAHAGCAFENSKLLEAAIKSASFIQENMWKDGHLRRRWREGEASFPAGLDEYAFLIRGLLGLFEATGDSSWLEWALLMEEILRREFKADEGAFFQSDPSEQNIILRKTQFSDGAEPSGNAIHCENLIRLYRLSYDTNYLNQAQDILRAANQFIENYSPGYSYHIMNLNSYYDRRSPTVIVALNQKEEHFQQLRKEIFTKFIPHKAVIWRRENDPEISKMLPFVKEYGPLKGKTTLYVCREGVCEAPLTDLEEMIGAIHKL